MRNHFPPAMSLVIDTPEEFWMNLNRAYQVLCMLQEFHILNEEEERESAPTKLLFKAVDDLQKLYVLRGGIPTYVPLGETFLAHLDDYVTYWNNVTELEYVLEELYLYLRSLDQEDSLDFDKDSLEYYLEKAFHAISDLELYRSRTE